MGRPVQTVERSGIASRVAFWFTMKRFAVCDYARYIELTLESDDEYDTLPRDDSEKGQAV